MSTTGIELGTMVIGKVMGPNRKPAHRRRGFYSKWDLFTVADVIKFFLKSKKANGMAVGSLG